MATLLNYFGKDRVNRKPMKIQVPKCPFRKWVYNIMARKSSSTQATDTTTDTASTSEPESNDDIRMMHPQKPD